MQKVKITNHNYNSPSGNGIIVDLIGCGFEANEEEIEKIFRRMSGYKNNKISITVWSDEYATILVTYNNVR